MREEDLELLRARLAQIKEIGWIKNRRPGNVGGIGNTLEDLLEVPENNLRLPDFGAWELKSQRSHTAALLTLFHCEPKPRKAKIMPRILLPLYGWPHQEAGTKYPPTERSFRQTINTTSYSDRGFRVNVDRAAQRIFISFDFGMIDDRHAAWRSAVENGAGDGDIVPHPYWTFDDIAGKLRTKINNLMYIRAQTRRVDGEEYYKYNEIEAHIDPTLERFISLVESGDMYVDFDARTGHNHGTKFRLRPASRTELYQHHIRV